MVTFLNFSDPILNLIKIFGITLVLVTGIFYLYNLKKNHSLSKNLLERAYSWWFILGFYVICTGINNILIYVGFALVSFISHREMVSNLSIPLKLRRIVLWSYLAIPCQYYLAYRQDFLPFLLFIPVVMLFLLSLRTIIEDEAQGSFETLTKLQWSLMLTTYNISHIAYFASLPDIPGRSGDYQFFIFFLVFICQMNDIFQYIFGKIFGRSKITPNISPNKTYAGFLGGLVGSLALGYWFSGLLPLTLRQALLAAGLISITGFLGDINISTVKRSLNIKNMSNFIPGHGGVLDRVDSLTFSSIIFFYLIYYWIYI